MRVENLGTESCRIISGEEEGGYRGQCKGGRVQGKIQGLWKSTERSQDGRERTNDVRGQTNISKNKVR